MADETRAACKYCGGEGVIVAFRVLAQLLYQGRCLGCGQVAVENTNYDRAVDFWNSWQAQKDEPAPPVAEMLDVEERFDFDLTAPEPDDEEPEHEGNAT